MADNRIAYGLAKEHGIDTTDMSPKEVWDALKKKGITQESVSEGKAKETKDLQSKSIDELKAMAKKETPDDIKRKLGLEPRLSKNNDISSGQESGGNDRIIIKGARRKVESLRGKPEGTYDYFTDDSAELNDGYMGMFHQNEPDKNGHYKNHYGRYTDEEYDRLSKEFARDNDAEVYIGVFDDEPEISFKVKTLEQAKRLMIEHNQKSIWDNKRKREIKNKNYDKTKNPMRGD